LRANGFRGPIVAFDFRSHGHSPKLQDHSWTQFGDDVAEILSRVDGAVVGVGHSMGATALLQSALVAPERYLGLVLVEPIVFPPSTFDSLNHPLVVGASRRRREFDSAADALGNFADKAVFSRWVDDALAAYVEGGLVSEADKWVLACEPLHEAEVFSRSGSDGVYDRLEELAVPIWLVVGEDTDTYPPGYVEILGDRIAGAQLAYVAGAGHFVPMEQPGELASVIITALGRFEWES
jgi:pimeloyl-ACP methyl ester carboxylesterase